MKLDDAYNAWGGQSENRELAQKTKTLFRKMWWWIHTNKPCNYYTLPVLARALQQANGAQSDKVKAASVMCHVLNYAHNVDPEGNNKPDFIFSDIVNYTGEKDDRGQVPGSQQQMTGDRSLAEQTREDALPGTRPLSSPKAAKAVVQRDAATLQVVKEWPSSFAAQKELGIKNVQRAIVRHGKSGGFYYDNGKAVVQLDAETLKPVKVWPSCFAAQKELGINNVQRAIVRHGISGGFYWCRPGDEEGFKPLEKRGRKKGKNKTKTEITEKPKKFTEEEKELHRKVFDEARGGDARGQSPDREPVKVQSPGIERPQPETLQEAHENLQQAIAEHVDQVLQKCTDDELIAELRRREWHGTLRITRIIEL